MQLSQKLEYAVLGVVYLAEQKRHFVLISEIAKKNKIPPVFLNKIFQKLARADILESKRGKEGGWRLKKNPANISVYDIAFSVEGGVLLKKCLAQNILCCSRGFCKLSKVWHGAQKAVIKTFKQAKIKDLT